MPCLWKEKKKKLDLKKFWVLKDLGPNKFLVQKYFVSKKILGPKKFRVPNKILGPEKVWVSKTFGPKNLRSKTIWGPKKISV